MLARKHAFRRVGVFGSLFCLGELDLGLLSLKDLGFEAAVG